MTVYEPATLITDGLLAVIGFALASMMRRRVGLGHPALLWWHRALISMAIGASLGGLYHGFVPNFSKWVDGVWWRLVLANISLIGLTMGMSLTHELGLRAWWRRLVWVKCLATIIAVMVWPEFVVAILDYGSVMMLWLVAAVVLRRRWSPWMAAAVVLSAVAAWVQQSGLSLSGTFNHNDLFHVIQAFALAGFFQAGLRMGNIPCKGVGRSSP
ncbi:MAG: hypothetical protein CFE26_20470 [Verrucomicrobiales bacterium VVV1]|nr:MAG: hypothetical protein CFE26_20470 [Verrucomicrobiales bacterium VVV1]